MKTLYAIMVSSFLAFGSAAYGGWAEDFPVNAARGGTDFAVLEALKLGAAPADIAAIAQQAGPVEIEPEGVVKALFCAGFSGSVVNKAAADAGLAESVVAAGYRQSVQQCGPAGRLKPDPFSRTGTIAGGGTTYRGQGGPPGTPPGGGGPSPVILPPVVGVGGTPPPNGSPNNFN